MNSSEHPAKESAWLLALCSAVCFAFLLLCSVPAWEQTLRGENDFLQLYAGARLVGTPDLYSEQATIRIHGEAVGGYIPGIYYSRPPFYAVLLKPLSWLPYLTAYAIFQTLSLIAFAIFLWRWQREFRALIVFSSLSIPLLTNVLVGQDLTLVLLLAGSFVLLARRGHDFLAGLVLSLCAIKFHLFVLAPIAVLIYRRWKILYGGLCGIAALTALSFFAAGGDWPQHYITQLSNPVLHGSRGTMPTLYGLVSTLDVGGSPTLVALSALIVCLFAYVAMQVRDFEKAFAFSLIAGLLVSYHAFMHDCILLLLSLAILSSVVSPGVRILLAFTVAPPPYIILMMGPPFNAILIGLLTAILVFATQPTVSLSRSER